MCALHSVSREIDPEMSATYLRSAVEMYGSGGTWNNVFLGTMNTIYIIAAFFRCLYAAITFSSYDNNLKNDTINHLRRPSCFRQLVALLESCSYLDCHIASKFLRLMTKTIQFEPHQSGESMDLIIIYDLLKEASTRIILPIFHILKQASTRTLHLPEQILCTELASLFATICRQTSYVKYSTEFEVQKICVEKSLERYISTTIMKTFIAMIIYDLQLDSGSSHGSYVSHLFEETYERRETMRLECITILSELIQRCQNTRKYECLETLIYSEVFKKYPIRRSLMYELLDQANTGLYQTSLEVILSEYSQRAERILKLAICKIYNTQENETNNDTERVIVLTNYCYYVLKKPCGIRCLSTSEEESQYNNPVIISQKFYKNITRICRGFPGRQFLMIGFCEEDYFGNMQETWDIIILNKVYDCNPLLLCAYSLSGPSEDERVNILKDIVMRICLQKYIKSLKNILTSSFAYRMGNNKNYLALYVLTENTFYEFTVDWRSWFCMDPNQNETEQVKGHYDEEDSNKEYTFQEIKKAKSGLNNFIGFVSENDNEWNSKEVNNNREEAKKRNKEEVPEFIMKLVGIKKDTIFEGTAAKVEAAKKTLLSLTFKNKIANLKAVEFNPGEEAITTYEFKMTKKEKKETEEKRHKIKVIYLDDTSRELWKRYVALALNRSENSSEWIRHWTPQK